MKKIAIIEDNSEINNLVKRILLTENYEVMQIFTGSDVLTYFDSVLKCDIILLDIMLPDMDGFEIYEKIKEQSPESTQKIIFLTARSDTYAQNFFTKNNCRYIIKPFDPYEFLETIRSTINNSS